MTKLWGQMTKADHLTASSSAEATADGKLARIKETDHGFLAAKRHKSHKDCIADFFT
jgi:hypothetical protein